MTTNASRPELKFNRYDAVVAAIVALLAVAVALWFYLPKTQSGELTVVISTGGEETERVKLNSFTETTVTHNGYTLRITADDSGVRVADSDCPTRTAYTPEPSPARGSPSSACPHRWSSIWRVRLPPTPLT